MHLYKGKVEPSDMRGGIQHLHRVSASRFRASQGAAIEVVRGEFGLAGFVSHLPRLVLSLRDLRAEGAALNRQPIRIFGQALLDDSLDKLSCERGQHMAGEVQINLPPRESLV